MAASWITYLGDLAVHPYVAKLAHQHHVDVVNELRDTPGSFVEFAVLVAKGIAKGIVKVSHAIFVVPRCLAGWLECSRKSRLTVSC